jgi:hypothetical protein
MNERLSIERLDELESWDELFFTDALREARRRLTAREDLIRRAVADFDEGDFAAAGPLHQAHHNAMVNLLAVEIEEAQNAIDLLIARREYGKARYALLRAGEDPMNWPQSEVTLGKRSGS